MAQKNQSVIMNLRRLQKLLLGQLTFESIAQLERLLNASFKGDAYEQAEAPLTSIELSKGDESNQATQTETI